MGRIYWDMLDSQNILPALSRELEEAMKLHQQREHVREAANLHVTIQFEGLACTS
jgi:c-di-GMP-binding flagellar brake protein YcgR